MLALHKKLIAGATMVVIGISLYFGTYLPYRASRAFIDALGQAGYARSLDEFLGLFAPVFKVPAPAGHEEIARNLANTLVSIIQQNGRGNTALVERSLAALDEYLGPTVARGRGFSYGQVIYVLGSAQDAAFGATGNVAYSDRAQEYYRTGLKLSPNRPQFLYALFASHQSRGQREQMRAVGAQILELWPDDQQVDQALRALR